MSIENVLANIRNSEIKQPSQINELEYYALIQDKIMNSFDHANYVAFGWNNLRRYFQLENISPEFISQLTMNLGNELYLPIFGSKDEDKSKITSILAPVDIEIYLGGSEGDAIYSNQGSNYHYHMKYIKPIADYLEQYLQNFAVPYLMDMTPSGFHILMQLENGTSSWDKLKEIGYLEKELISSTIFKDDRFKHLNRNPPPGFEATSAFSGFKRLWHYISLGVKKHFKEVGNLPVTISHPEFKCMNLDNSWMGDPGYMRIMRSPFSIHRKNIDKFGKQGPPLCDVIRTYSDGTNIVSPKDTYELVEAMWNFEKAVNHSNNFNGNVPVVKNQLNPIIDEYKQTGLFEWITQFDEKEDLELGEALHRAINDDSIQGYEGKTRSVIELPHPRALQPRALKLWIWDLYHNVGWHSKDIACLLNDLYHQKQDIYGRHIDWGTNWDWNGNYPPEYIKRVRANFWVKTYASVLDIETGRRNLIN